METVRMPVNQWFEIDRSIVRSIRMRPTGIPHLHWCLSFRCIIYLPNYIWIFEWTRTFDIISINVLASLLSRQPTIVATVHFTITQRIEAIDGLAFGDQIKKISLLLYESIQMWQLSNRLNATTSIVHNLRLKIKNGTRIMMRAWWL